MKGSIAIVILAATAGAGAQAAQSHFVTCATPAMTDSGVRVNGTIEILDHLYQTGPEALPAGTAARARMHARFFDGGRLLAKEDLALTGYATDTTIVLWGPGQIHDRTTLIVRREQGAWSTLGIGKSPVQLECQFRK